MKKNKKKIVGLMMLILGLLLILLAVVVAKSKGNHMRGVQQVISSEEPVEEIPADEEFESGEKETADVQEEKESSAEPEKM